MNIKKFNLKHKDILFLKENFKETGFLQKIQESKHKSLSIPLSEEEVEVVLDELTFLFTLKGIDKDGEPNKLGLYIEGLIDLFRQGM